MKVPASLQALPAHASRNASLFISLLLGAGIGTELARIAMSLVLGSHSAPMPPPPPAAPTHAPRVSAASIVSSHLFGRLETVSAQDPDKAPASTASLKLVGTLAGRDPAAGLALLSDEGKASVLKIGESLTGASLRYVYADHVILDRAGTLERLSLERAPPGAGQGIVKTTAPRETGRQAGARKATPPSTVRATHRHLRRHRPGHRRRTHKTLRAPKRSDP
jgi:type II secretory pathway component PulC